MNFGKYSMCVKRKKYQSFSKSSTSSIFNNYSILIYYLYLKQSLNNRELRRKHDKAKMKAGRLLGEFQKFLFQPGQKLAKLIGAKRAFWNGLSPPVCNLMPSHVAFLSHPVSRLWGNIPKFLHPEAVRKCVVRKNEFLLLRICLL